MKFEISELRKKGFVVKKRGVKETIRKEDGSNFELWLGNKMGAHGCIPKVSKLVLDRSYKGRPAGTYFIDNKYGSMIFDIGTVDLFAGEELHVE